MFEGTGKSAPLRWFVLGLYCFSQIVGCRDLAGEIARRPFSEKPFRHLRICSESSSKFKNQFLFSTEWDYREAQHLPVRCKLQVGRRTAALKNNW